MPVGHVPVAQLEALEEAPLLAENVENIFSVAFEPHFSQPCDCRLPGFSRNDVTCPHFLQRYSKIGMVFLLIRVPWPSVPPPGSAPAAPRIVQL